MRVIFYKDRILGPRYFSCKLMAFKRKTVVTLQNPGKFINIVGLIENRYPFVRPLEVDIVPGPHKIREALTFCFLL